MCGAHTKSLTHKRGRTNPVLRKSRPSSTIQQAVKEEAQAPWAVQPTDEQLEPWIGQLIQREDGIEKARDNLWRDRAAGLRVTAVTNDEVQRAHQFVQHRKWHLPCRPSTRERNDNHDEFLNRAPRPGSVVVRRTCCCVDSTDRCGGVTHSQCRAQDTAQGGDHSPNARDPARVDAWQGRAISGRLRHRRQRQLERPLQQAARGRLGRRARPARGLGSARLHRRQRGARDIHSAPRPSRGHRPRSGSTRFGDRRTLVGQARALHRVCRAAVDHVH